MSTENTQTPEYLEINRDGWNKRTDIHLKSDWYDVAGFMAGNNTLPPDDINDVGDVKGKSLLHLQCHFGQDTLSWARLGADVTGMDISDNAIEAARKLNDDLGLSGKFVRSDVYDLPNQLEGSFDIVYSSYGATCWLEDLDKWAEVIKHFLKPGGAFHLLEFHPVIRTVADDGKSLGYLYADEEPWDETTPGTYTDGGEEIMIRSIDFTHTVADHLNALIQAGLQIEFLREYTYQYHDCWSGMIEIAPNKWVFEVFGQKLPYVMSIKATKPL